MPIGWSVCASRISKALAPACFIRYAAAAAWSFCRAVVAAGRMMSATVAGGCGDWDGAWGAGASAMTAPYGGSWVCWRTMRASSTREPLLSLRNTWHVEGHRVDADIHPVGDLLVVQ